MTEKIKRKEQEETRGGLHELSDELLSDRGRASCASLCY